MEKISFLKLEDKFTNFTKFIKCNVHSELLRFYSLPNLDIVDPRTNYNELNKTKIMVFFIFEFRIFNAKLGLKTFE